MQDTYIKQRYWVKLRRSALCWALAISLPFSVAAYTATYASGINQDRLVQLAQDESDNEEEKEGAQSDPSSAPPPANAKILVSAIPKISGPKRTVAVGKFTSTGAFSAKYGSWDIGGGLSAMLVSALVESQRFVVVERANLQRVLSEKELKKAGLVNKSTGPGSGKLVGVQLFILGAVTEFGTDDEGGGFSIGGSGGGIGSLLSGALSSQSSGGSMAIDFRVVDSTSGQIIETHRIREPIDSSSFDLSLGYKGVNFGGNKFYKTPIGQAARRMITKTVQKIAINAGKAGWAGQVVDFDGKELYINAGTRSGIQKGDMFMVERIVKRLTDPTTGEVLSLRKKELGIVKISGVEKKVSYGSFQPLETTPPKRGDFVAIMKK